MPRPPSNLSSLIARLDVRLPPGEIVAEHGAPALWLSSAPPPAGLWALLRAAHPASGLWPLLVNGIGAFDQAAMSSSPDHHSADVVLAQAWQELLPRQDSEHFASILEDMRPFGATWPGASVRPPPSLIQGQPRTPSPTASSRAGIGSGWAWSRLPVPRM